MHFRPHISLDVTDLEAAVRFYQVIFGVEPTKRYPDYANFRLEYPALHLALVHRPDRDPSPRGDEHFGVEIFDPQTLHTWRERVEAAGVTPRIEQQVTCCYAVGDKFWVQDPDGHEWEFWVRTDEAETLYAPQPAAVPCCS